jgi:hypothetical protein
MKKTPAIRCLTAALAATCGLLGQQYTPVLPTPPSPEVLSPEIDVFQSFTSVDVMTRFSDLIVEGTVMVAGPTVRLDANQPVPVLETDSVIAVSRTFRDVFSSTRSPASQIILVQIGGKFAGWDVQPKGVPLVQPDERYILFLRQVCGAVSWNKSGLPRYEALGVWSGLVKVVSGKVQFLPKAALPLHETDGLSVEAFSAGMEARIGKLPENSLVIDPPPNFRPTGPPDPSIISTMERKPCSVEAPQ